MQLLFTIYGFKNYLVPARVMWNAGEKSMTNELESLKVIRKSKMTEVFNKGIILNLLLMAE